MEGVIRVEVGACNTGNADSEGLGPQRGVIQGLNTRSDWIKKIVEARRTRQSFSGKKS